MFRVIVMVFACLTIVGCNRSEIDKLQQENVQLKEQVQTLQTEIIKLKETADFYFQSGVDNFNSKNYGVAEENFQNVVEKYPNSPIVKNAREYLVKTKRMIAEERRKKEEIERLQGTPIDYVTFYSKANGGGLPIGKRYRFEADIDDHLFLRSIYGKKPLFCDKAFDDISQLENFLKEPKGGSEYIFKTIVASMGWNGRICIHRIE